MANAVFTTQLTPGYDDLPELRYHFPRRYLRQAQQTIGDWIIYYEPRRESLGGTRATGRQSYFAIARVERIEADAKRADHFYAHVTGYLQFPSPVPFRSGEGFFESALEKADGTTNRGKFGWALRLLAPEEFRLICQAGFVGAAPSGQPPDLLAIREEPAEYGKPRRLQLLERPFRDAAFSRVVQEAYNNTCALTGLRLINGGGRCEIEAAHIRPVAEDGPDSPRNGLALSRTVHWMFDRGLVSVSESGQILVAQRSLPDQAKRLLNPDGRAILPRSPDLLPHPVFLRYHRETKFKGD